MLFNSFGFAIFFPIVTLIYFLLPFRWRWLWLLMASCFFYATFIPVYLSILFLTILIDYWAAIYIEKSIGSKRKIFLIVSILSTITVLFVFKYFNFFIDNMSAVIEFFHWNYSLTTLKIILPIGLSFHTFQSLSYVIEVYRGKQKAEKHFGIYSLYVMFYPQLVAGPIERPQNLLPQFYVKHEFEYERVVSGLKLMARGLFKKMVIADRLAVLVNSVFSSVDQYSGWPLLVAAIFFTFQIYCDFSGYSDIAIGSAEVMGFKLMKNFDRPYISTSIAEYWRRNHISLSTWFRDYLYIPLGGNRKGKYRKYFNLFLTFLVSGFWHGANWTFIIWGALHGFYLIFSLVTMNIRVYLAKIFRFNFFPRLVKVFQNLITFFLICFSFIFFRANNLNDAIYVVGHFYQRIFSMDNFKQIFNLGLGEKDFYLVLILIIGLMFFQVSKKDFSEQIKIWPWWVRWSIYYLVIFSILFLAAYSGEQFIYFQF